MENINRRSRIRTPVICNNGFMKLGPRRPGSGIFGTIFVI
jgi:hypothetical protein